MAPKMTAHELFLLVREAAETAEADGRKVMILLDGSGTAFWTAPFKGPQIPLAQIEPGADIGRQFRRVLYMYGEIMGRPDGYTDGMRNYPGSMNPYTLLLILLPMKLYLYIIHSPYRSMKHSKPVKAVVERYVRDAADHFKTCYLKRTEFGNVFVSSRLDQDDIVMVKFQARTSYAKARRMINEFYTREAAI